MHDATETLVPAISERPAFWGPRWNGWAITGLAIICIAGFVMVQTVVFVIVFFGAHPEVIKYGYVPAALAQQLKDPAFVTDLLTAKNLWFLSVLSEGVLALLTVWLARVAFRANWRSLGLGPTPKTNWPALGVSVGVLLFFASAIVDALLTKLFGPHPQPQALALIKHHGAFDFVLDFMSVSMAAPFAEEIFFRGFVFAGLAQRMSPQLAVVLSALLFGLAHLERWSFLPIFVIGTGLAWLYYRTQSLWVNIVAHATVNTVSLILAYTMPQLVNS